MMVLTTSKTPIPTDLHLTLLSHTHTSISSFYIYIYIFILNNFLSLCLYLIKEIKFISPFCFFHLLSLSNDAPEPSNLHRPPPLQKWPIQNPNGHSRRSISSIDPHHHPSLFPSPQLLPPTPQNLPRIPCLRRLRRLPPPNLLLWKSLPSLRPPLRSGNWRLDPQF